jgi:hypothetical protein
MMPRPGGSAVTEQRSRAGRTLVAIWVFVALVLGAVAVWLQVLGPPLGSAGTAPPVAAAGPQAPVANATRAAEAPTAPEPPKPPGR